MVFVAQAVEGVLEVALCDQVGGAREYSRA